MKRLITFLLLYSIFSILYSGQAAGQTTHNLDIIWQKAKPETPPQWQAWGFAMVGGDLNGDGYSDFVSAIASEVTNSPQRYMLKIYIFNGGLAIDTIPSQIITYDSIGGSFSFCIADFNGDSINDLAVGDAGGLGVNDSNGQVNIHYGTGVDLNPTPDLVIGGYGSATATAYGWDISGGDLNGDGIDDLIVGAPYWGPMYSLGRVYVYYGDTLGLHTWPDMIINGHIEAGYYEYFGNSVDGTVDYNNDGYNELVIGAYCNCKTANSAGKIYYYLSNNATLDTIPDGWIYGEGPEHWLGFYVNSVNVDTIGFNPMGWFGTPNWPSGSFGAGKCYMVPGDSTGEITPEWTITGEDTGLGYWSSSAGYADKDKLGDFLVGAAPAFNLRGKAYLWLRRPTMNNACDAYILGRYSGGTGMGDVLGARVAPAGDVDGDGKDEFMVSNYFADSSNMIWLCKYTGPDAVAGQPPVDPFTIASLKLFENVPNPFSQQTTIKYQVSQSGKVSLKVYNISGQVVRVLVNEETSPSNPSPRGEGRVGSVVWDGRDDTGNRVSNGIYIYQLKTGGESMVKKMTLLR
jgi:hypothetical protein